MSAHLWVYAPLVVVTALAIVWAVIGVVRSRRRKQPRFLDTEAKLLGAYRRRKDSGK